MGQLEPEQLKEKQTIDISTGISNNSEIEMTIATQGMNITGTTKGNGFKNVIILLIL